MKSILFVVGLIVSFSAIPFKTEKQVYICNGSASSKYHLVKDCKGLEKCSTEIDSMSVRDAKDLGRTLCGWED